MRTRSRSLRSLGLTVVLGLFPLVVAAQSAPRGAARGFRLQARALSAITVNRVYCGLDIAGELCVDSTNSSIRGGGYWPKGSPQQYIYNSGVQLVGRISAEGDWAWAGDTAGGFFFDPKGTTRHGQGVDGFWNYSVATDRSAWPAAASVPSTGTGAELFAPDLRGRPSASDGDVWSLAWEGDPALFAGRPHPLGVALETRVLGWDRPRWNDDIVYFVHTLYNVTSACPADYANVHPELRDALVELGRRFQALNLARTGVVIPECGYDVDSLYVGQSVDADVSSDAGANFAFANLPLGMAYAYEHTFRVTEGAYQLPPALTTPSFTNGYGFVGIKILRGLEGGPVDSAIRLYSNTTGGGLLNDPQNVFQLYRYLSGQINQGLGDGACNYVPSTDRICYIRTDTPSDTRFWFSSGPAALPRGGAITFATAYIYAGAVATAGCPVAGCGGGTNEVKPPIAALVRRLRDATLLASDGASLLDSMTGFRGYSDLNGDGQVQGREFQAVNGSLIHKAQLAQAVFDAGFVVPTAPEAPPFFLVPGDGKVAIFWRPSATETTGDGYFNSAAAPASPSSPLYDPNYREFDVQGYRIYRGRTDDPSQMTLLAQFDHDGEDTEGHSLDFRDYLGVAGWVGACAPELGLNLESEGCPIDFDDAPPPGGAYTTYQVVSLDEPFIQVRLGDRLLKADGGVYVTVADTLITGGNSGLPGLDGTGVPFSFLDSTVTNDRRYYYTVVAFDVNSIQSGPSSLESARVLRSVVPMHPASNVDQSAAVTSSVYGRGVDQGRAIPKAPTIDPGTGVFSGPARPATGASLAFSGRFLEELMSGSGTITLTLDSMRTGSAYDPVGEVGASFFYFTITSAVGSVQSTYAFVQDQFSGANYDEVSIDGGPVDPSLVARYGGSGAYRLSALATLSYPGNYYTGSYGRGCTNAAPGFVSAGRCAYNGARWFDGTNETFPHPTRGNGPNTTAATPAITNFTNAGNVTGVANIFEGRSYQTRPNVYRAVEGVLGTAATAADYRLYWGTAGKVDSVVDITHNVRVEFDTTMKKGYTWGFLTQTAATAGGNSADGRTALTLSDLGCVPPIKTFATANGHLGCPGAPVYHFVDSLTFGAVAFGTTVATDGSVAARPGEGFGIYLAGHFFLFEMNSPTPVSPPKGTVWTMRSYVGAISGGGGTVGTAGDLGAYAFQSRPSPLTAVGAQLRLEYDVVNVRRKATEDDLAEVHTVPDPFYATNGYGEDAGDPVIKFVNLPERAIVRIYSLSGVLVRVLEHISPTYGGSLDWDLQNRDGRAVAPGVYFYAIEAASGARRVGRMTIVSYIQ